MEAQARPKDSVLPAPALSQRISAHGTAVPNATPNPTATVDSEPSTVLLKAGLIATPGGRFVADLLIRDGWITAIGSSASSDAAGRTGVTAERVIDAMGRVVLPGWVLPCLPSPGAAPPHLALAAAGVTCAGWAGPAGDDPTGPWGCDLVRMEPIEEAQRIACAAAAIHEHGRVAFVLAADRGRGLLDAAAPVLASLRATLIIAADGRGSAAVALAERAATAGGRVVVGPLREPPLAYRAAAAGVLAATDPAWLVDDPALWQAAADGAVRLLLSGSGRPPGVDALYRSGPARGLASLETLAALLGARPAALLGCGAKGLLAPGRQADLCLLEPAGGDAATHAILLRGGDAHRPHGRIVTAEPVDGFA